MSRHAFQALETRSSSSPGPGRWRQGNPQKNPAWPRFHCRPSAVLRLVILYMYVPSLLVCAQSKPLVDSLLAAWPCGCAISSSSKVRSGLAGIGRVRQALGTKVIISLLFFDRVFGAGGVGQRLYLHLQGQGQQDAPAGLGSPSNSARSTRTRACTEQVRSLGACMQSGPRSMAGATVLFTFYA